MRFELGQEVECELHGIEAGQSSRESGLRRGRAEAVGDGIFGSVIADLGFVGGCIGGRMISSSASTVYFHADSMSMRWSPS